MRKVKLASSIVTYDPYQERPVLSLQFKQEQLIFDVKLFGNNLKSRDIGQTPCK